MFSGTNIVPIQDWSIFGTNIFRMKDWSRFGIKIVPTRFGTNVVPYVSFQKYDATRHLVPQVGLIMSGKSQQT